VDARHLLAAACRILAHHGHACGLAGQVTCRDADGQLWTLPLGLGLDEASADQVIRIDDALRGVETNAVPNPATRFHLAIYEKRRDVRAIVHTHPPALAAFSMLGRRLPIAHMDDCLFFGDCSYLPQWPGVPVGDEEGRIISGALADKSCALLAGHGYVATGSSLQLAIYRAVYLEHAAARVLRALAAGEPVELQHGVAEEAREFLLQPSIVQSTFNYWQRQSTDNARRHHGI
jgi:L-fuculose-phosphate aldolase